MASSRIGKATLYVRLGAEDGCWSANPFSSEKRDVLGETDFRNTFSTERNFERSLKLNVTLRLKQQVELLDKINFVLITEVV